MGVRSLMAPAAVHYLVSGFLLLVAADKDLSHQAPLARLTAPAHALPNGCELAAPESRYFLGTLSGSVVIPQNPWSGTDHKLRSAARSAIDGSPSLPDAPPFDRQGLAALEATWVADVAEAYRAVYRSAERAGPDVWAVRFADVQLATNQPPVLREFTGKVAPVRLVDGATVITVSGNESSDCFKAVVAHLQSAK